MVMVEDGHSLIDHGTLKSAISQEQLNKLNWVFACWHKFRKAKIYSRN